MQYLLYCIVCFRVQGTTKEVFVADDVDATLTNQGYLCNNTFMMQRLHQCGT
jgi:hypothetical protein